MAIWEYKALDKEGAVAKGKISAQNEAELEKKLSQSGMDLIDAKIIKSSGIGFFHSVKPQELILFCIHMYQLERAGVPILDSIAELRDSLESQTLKNIVMDINESLKNGKLLSSALADHPRIFDNTFTALVAAGEKTGGFAEIFEHLERHLKWVYEIKAKLKKATYYPMFLFVLMSAVISIMMIFVIPKLSAFLLSQNLHLPAYTTALIATSNFIVDHWDLLLSIPIVSYATIKALRYSSQSFAYKLDSLYLMLPFVGILIRKIETARFCHFFALSYKSGLGIVECLNIGGNVVSNLLIKHYITIVKNNVTEGKKLATALKETNQFPSLVIRMFKVGEDSGNLDVSLENVNHFYDQEINDAINNFVSMLQPALTLLMGGLLMWITLSVFGPIYSSFGSIK